VRKKRKPVERKVVLHKCDNCGSKQPRTKKDQDGKIVKVMLKSKTHDRYLCKETCEGAVR
jgi:hypothetical protein